MKKKKLTREAIARIEIGRTKITHGRAVFITFSFLLLIVAVPLGQLVLDRGEIFGSFSTLQLTEATSQDGQSFVAGANIKNKTLIKNMRGLETSLEEESFLRKLFLPPLQYLYLKYLDRGNEKVVRGQDGTLFYSAGMDYLVGQPFLAEDQLLRRSEGHEIWESPVQPDPVAAIRHFKEQLALHGIELLVVPVPVKGSIEPEKFVSANFVRPLRNSSWNDFLQELEAAKIHVFDAAPVLVEYSSRHKGAYLKTDTHWLPGAMEKVAESLAKYVKANFDISNGTTRYQVQATDMVGTGDIAKMLTLPENNDLFKDQKVTIHQVLTEQEEYWQPSLESEVLILGDSFANIYSFKGLNWGFAAGLGEHLSLRLKQPVDLIARNDSGAYVTREMLAREMQRGRDKLAGKKLVIWEFSEREFSSGDWKIIELQLKDPVEESEFFILNEGEKLKITGTVSSISVSPRPGTVPYTDNIVTLHLVDMRDDGGNELELGQSVVYGWGMRDNQLTDLAMVRPGDTLAIALSSWDDVEGEYGGFRRTTLADEMMELELPNWGDLMNE